MSGSAGCFLTFGRWGYEMNANLKAKWVEALRSGKYQQTKGRLRGDGGFCCLGVLCDISGAGGWLIQGGKQMFVMNDSQHRTGKYLPKLLRQRAGIEENDDSPLMDMNDGGSPFIEIADYIEKYL